MFTLCFASFIVTVHCISVGQEPQCSRFHYEEQLLEKMIRLEIKFEEMEKRTSDFNKNVNAVLENIKKEWGDMKYENNQLQLNYSKEIEKRITDISTLKATMLTETIAFKARGPDDYSLATGQTIIFQQIMLNEGAAYDKNTGTFTAPVSGTYIFTIQLCVNAGYGMSYGIIVDNSVVTSGYFGDSDNTKCYTADAILVLSGGEKIYVKCLAGGSTGQILHEYNTSSYNYWNTFSGLLVHR